MLQDASKVEFSCPCGSILQSHVLVISCWYLSRLSIYIYYWVWSHGEPFVSPALHLNTTLANQQTWNLDTLHVFKLVIYVYIYIYIFTINNHSHMYIELLYLFHFVRLGIKWDLHIEICRGSSPSEIPGALGLAARPGHHDQLGALDREVIAT